jgi:hypothetical protein
VHCQDSSAVHQAYLYLFTLNEDARVYTRASSLVLQVQAGVLALERRAADAASNTARGGWGSTAAQHEAAVPEQDLAAMQQDVAKMHDNYGALLKEFLTGLPAAAN